MRCKINRKSSENEILEYPLILKTILRNAPRLHAILDISQPSLFSIIQSHAKHIEVLTFEILPIESLFLVFFKNKVQEYVIDKLQKKKQIGMSFPKLKMLGLPYSHDEIYEFDFNDYKLFLQVFIHCYKHIDTLHHEDIKSVSSDLLMSEDIDIFKLIDKKPCKLKSVSFFDIQANTKHISALKKMCPLINHILIHTSKNSSDCSKEEMKNILTELNVSCLTLKIDWDQRLTPLDFSYVGTIKVLHLELSYSFCEVDFQLINSCENLECLKILLMTEYSKADYCLNEKDMKIMTNLTTLSFYGPFGTICNEDVEEHKSLLNWLIKYSPNLNSLEISMRDIEVIDNLFESTTLDNLQFFTLISEDYGNSSQLDEYTRKSYMQIIIPFVDSLKSLQTLVLYINPPTCAEIMKTFNKTALKIIDGTTFLFNETPYDILKKMDRVSFYL